MRYWIISDTHFNHTKLITYERPHNFEELLLKGLEKIDESDVLIHLGDICMGKDQYVHDEIISKIKCFKKILVRGNHDNKSDSWYYRNGWDCVCNGLSINYGGKRIYFSHKPKKITKSHDMNVHGHFHVMERPDRIDEFHEVYDESYHKLISMEYLNYNPIILDKLLY